MTEQEFKDREHEFQLRQNIYKIELAQKILREVYAPEINTFLKEACISVEQARQLNAKYLHRATELSESHSSKDLK